MAFSLLITGGARSGKSAFAEQRVAEFGPPLVYIATAEAFDSEMKDRIALHRARRGTDWQTVHVPLNLPQALRETDGEGACLVDCLTIWLNNLVFAEQEIATATEQLVAAIAARSDPVVLVTNEVGGGIVPENALARRFRDQAGLMNQTIANAVDEVYVSISGISVRIKPHPH